MDSKRKTSLILLVILILFFIAPVQNFIVSNPLFQMADDAAEEHTSAALKRALIAYGSARVTNAFISMLQETEISAQPGGLGVTVAFFQLLDPLNDLVERFSSIMLLVIISLGIQSFLILLGPWMGAKLIMLGLLLWIAGLWLKDRINIDLVAFGKTVIVLAVFVRFIMPIMAGANDAVYNALLDSKYEKAIGEIRSENEEFAERSGGSYEDVQEIRDMLREFEEKSVALAEIKRDERKFDRLKETGEITAMEVEIERLKNRINTYEKDDREVSITGIVADVKEWINPSALKKKVERMIDKFLSLIMVFIINTIVFPLLFLWLSIKALKVVSSGAFVMTLERKFKEQIVKSKE
ncbi:MAG: hypothetical protein JSV21_04665 [Nitrospirota bacterium]|nr:MAG: hypothetical protein JSV21_04665 [Nitrospirota bacterium]